MNKRLESNIRSRSGKSEILIMAAIGIIIAAAITFFILKIIGHSEEHVAKVKKAKIFYRESLSWRPDSKLCEKRILSDLVKKPNRKKAKYQQLTLSSQAIEYIGQMSKLKSLELNQSKFDEDDLEYLTKLPLEELTLFGTPVSDRSIKYILAFKNLRKLDIGDTEITDEGLKKLVKAQNLVNLNLEHSTKITDDGIIEITKLRNLNNLNLSYTKATRKTMGYIANLKGIRKLRLRGIKLDPEDLRNLQNKKYLQLLFLNDSGINDSHLAEIGKFTRLLNLDISMNNNISDKGIMSLSKLTRLHNLTMKDCSQLTDSGASKLQAMLPNTRVDFRFKDMTPEDYHVDEIYQEVKLFEKRQLNTERELAEPKSKGEPK